jgi:hypothetical protein
MDSPEPSNDVISNLPLAIGILTTLFIASRILSAADFNPETAYAILQAGGTAAVLVGATLQSLPVIPPFLVGTYFLLTDKPFGDYQSPRRQLLLFGQMSFLVVAVFLAPVGALVVVAVSTLIGLPVGFFIGMRQTAPFRKALKRAGGENKDSNSAELDAVAADVLKKFTKTSWRMRAIQILWIAAAFTLIIVFNTSIWLPSEHLTVKGRPIVGYVLSVDATYYAILLTNSKTVIYVDEATVSARTLCASQTSWFSRSLPSLFYTRNNYPQCPR